MAHMHGTYGILTEKIDLHLRVANLYLTGRDAALPVRERARRALAR